MNLTHGGRTLKFSAKLGNEEEITVNLLKVVQNFHTAVRNEVLNDATVYLRERAVRYIREGQERSLVPDNSERSYGLKDSFRSYYTETDTVTVAMGEGVPYAVIHNLPPGTTYSIYPQNFRFLMFKWYKQGGKKTLAQHVERPGVGYWTRALKDTRRRMPKIARYWVDYFSEHDPSVSQATGAKLRGNARARSQNYR